MIKLEASRFENEAKCVVFFFNDLFSRGVASIIDNFSLSHWCNYASRSESMFNYSYIYQVHWIPFAPDDWLKSVV